MTFDEGKYNNDDDIADEMRGARQTIKIDSERSQCTHESCSAPEDSPNEEERVVIKRK